MFAIVNKTTNQVVRTEVSKGACKRVAIQMELDEKLFDIREVKGFRVNSAYFNKSKFVEMTETEFEKWVQVNANAHYGFYRVVGEPTSGHYYIDFEEMWEITVLA